MPAAPPAGRPGGYGYLPTAPAGTPVAACRAACRPSRRLRLPADRGTRPGARRTQPAGRARCGRQAWLLACVGHGCGRLRPGRPWLSQAGVAAVRGHGLRRPQVTAVAVVGPGPLRSTGVASGVCGSRLWSTAAGSAGAVAGRRGGHPWARLYPASALCRCPGEARSGGGGTRRHPVGAGLRTLPARTGTGAQRTATSETSASASRAAAVPPSLSAAAPGPAAPEPPPAPSGTGPAAVGARPPSRPRRPRHRRLHRPSKRRPCREAGPSGIRGPRGPTDSHGSPAQALLHHPSPSLPPSPDRTI